MKNNNIKKESKQVTEKKSTLPPKSVQNKNPTRPKENKSQLKKPKPKNNENTKANIESSVKKETGVKGQKLSEPQLKVTVDKSKIEAGIKKTPLGQITSVLSKIKTGEV